VPATATGDIGGHARCGWRPPDRTHGAPAVGRSVEGDRAAVEHDDAAGEGEDPVDLLLHDEHGRARGEDAVEHGVDLGGVDRVEAERQLVGHEHTRLERQDPGEGEDALLAARQGAGELVAALAEAGEGREGLVEDAGPTAPAEPAAERQRQVLLDGEGGEHRPALGGVGHAGPGDLVRRAARHVAAADHHAPGRGSHQAGRHPGHRRLPHAVGADDRHRVPGPDPQRHAEQRPEPAVPGVDPVELEHGLAVGRHVARVCDRHACAPR
jgi:hypothetical protein